MEKRKKLVIIVSATAFIFLAGVAYIYYIFATLPQIITVKDYKPLLVSKVYDKNNKEIGEFARERRLIVPFEKFPKVLTEAFIAAEDSSFYEHSGINYIAIGRAVFANLRAGRKVQGGSTITQQVAKSLLLTPEKTYTRKIKEAILSYRMEANLTKEEILYLYLNQIYLGHGAWGVELASRTYFKKSVDKLDLKEAAILAGLPQAPSRYSPVINPAKAKERQIYVLGRMKDVGFITKEEAEKAIKEDIKVYTRENLASIAPYFVETIRLQLIQDFGEDMVLDGGLQIYTGLDYDKQVAANKEVQRGLRELSKRQGFRGATKNFTNKEEIEAFLKQTKREYSLLKDPSRIIKADGSIVDKAEESRQKKSKSDKNLPDFLDLEQIVQGIVEKVDDANGITHVRFAENRGLIDIETMKWARKPDPEVYEYNAYIAKPSQALKVGDLIEVKIKADKFSSERLRKKAATAKNLPAFEDYVALELEEEPSAEAALLSFDLQTEEVLTMVGGYDYTKSEFNRALQAGRQTGSSFKPLVYIAALDKGYAPNSVIVDSPVVYEEIVRSEEDTTVKKWKPSNYSEKFTGDVLLRNALIKSLNIPTIKIQADIGLPWVEDYSRRLGIFSALNRDQTLGLGSSSVTLYEMTKVYGHFGRMGVKMSPVLIRKVLSPDNQVLAETITLDRRFEKENAAIDADFAQRREDFLTGQNQPEATPVAEGAEPPPVDDSNKSRREKILAEAKARRVPPIFFKNEKQLISPTTAYLGTTLLSGVIEEGTGAAARALGRPAAGKTGTTNGFYDAWFIGYTPQVVTGVWVGHDTEKSLGVGETGAKSSLQIWLEFMKVAHVGLPVRSFSSTSNVVVASIDNETGMLASSSSKSVVRQAFLEGTEPTETNSDAMIKDSNEFFKEDLSY